MDKLNFPKYVEPLSLLRKAINHWFIVKRNLKVKKMKHINIYITIAFILFSCSKEDTPMNTNLQEKKLIKTIKYKNIAGVSDELLSLDIYYTDQMNLKPVVIYVHGGKWSNPNNHKSFMTENMVSLFQGQDYIFVSINYRLSPFPADTLNANRVKFPTHNKDVADAISWVHNNVRNYGGDADKIGLIGHSAGAHLVALTGTNEYFLNENGMSLSDIKGIVVIDTKAYDINERVANIPTKNLYVNAFGSNTQQYNRASPLLNIDSSKNHPKFLVIKRGNITSHTLANKFISTLSLNSVDVTSIDADQYSHKDVFLKIGESNEEIVTQPILNFFENCFQ